MESQYSPGGRVDKAIEDGWKKQVLRVIAHVDLDAFYSQVEVKNDPERLKGKPVGVMQYNPFGDLATYAPNEDRLFNDSNGSLIAVSYEARAFGVKRGMRGEEARKLCPELLQVQVPTAHGKADLTHYRSAGKQVTDILARLSICEKASIDECYLDVTKEAKRRLEACKGQLPLPKNVHELHICGQEGENAEQWWKRGEDEWTDDEKLLACGASTVADLRAAVREELGFSCSAGVSNCKILAKLASGMHKPSQQTVVPAGSVPGLLQDLPVPKLRQLGGKLGDEVMRVLNLTTVGELAKVPKARLTNFFPDSQACWLHELAHGIDADEVKQRTLPKSIGCGKTFHGKHTLYKIEDVTKWVGELAQELEERVMLDQEENSREPKLVTIHASSNVVSWNTGNAISRSGPLRRPSAEIIAEDAVNLYSKLRIDLLQLKKWTSMTPGWSVTGLSLVVSNFVSAPRGKSTLTRFFKASNGPSKPCVEISGSGKNQNKRDKDGREEYGEIPKDSNATLATNFVNTKREHKEEKEQKNQEAPVPKRPKIDFPWANLPKSETRASTVSDFRISYAAENSEQGENASSANLKPNLNSKIDEQSLVTGRDGSVQDQSDLFALPEKSLSSNHVSDDINLGTGNFANSIPENIDREIWASLPKDIQRELTLQSMSALRQRPSDVNPPNTHHKTKRKGNRPIAKFFTKKS